MYNDKAHVTMQPMTRELKIPKESKVIGVVGDNEGERVNIDIPRWYDGIDLGAKSIYIVVNNDAGESDMIIPEVQKDEEQLHITWLVLGKHVANEGSVYAHIRATDKNGFVWQSLDGEFEVKTAQSGAETMPNPQITAVNQKIQEIDTAKQQALSAAQDALAAVTLIAPPIVADASGSVITAEDGADRAVRKLTIYGKTTQDGTPTQDALVALESVGADGDVVISGCGKNLFNPAEAPKSVAAVTVEQIADGMRVTSTNATSLYTYAQWRVINDLCGTSLKNVTLSADAAANGEHTGRLRIGVYDGAGKVVGDYKEATGTGKLSVTIEISEAQAKRGNHVEVRLYAVATGTPGKGAYTDYSALQLELGASATEYEKHVGQTATITTPNGLPGVPATSGGNYTDANGQQWIADTIEYDADAGTEKYVKRVRVDRLTSTSRNWSKSSSVAGRYLFSGAFKTNARPMCTAFVAVDGGTEAGTVFNNQGMQMCFNTSFATIEDWKAYLDANEVYFAYAPVEPIEAEISAENAAALAALKTHHPQTTIYNDEGAHMDVGYVADTKIYIDNLVASAVAVALANK